MVPRTVSIRSAALWGILFLLVMYTLYFTAAITMPIALAFLLNLVLAPVVGCLEKLHIPRLVSAISILVSIMAAIAAALYALAGPASDWIDRAPSALLSLEYELAWVKGPIDDINATGERVDEIIDGDEEQSNGQTEEQSEPQEETFSLVDAVVSRTPNVVYGTAVTLILLFFMLSSNDSLLKKMVHITPSLRDKKRVVETTRDIQQHVSRYLGTITVINIALGGAVALAMSVLGMPNPILWGVMVGLLNYIPYLGVGLSIVIIGFVSLLTFDSPGQILLPPATVLALNVLEGQFLTPALAGRRLSLSPVAVFLSIVMLGWLWGVIGVLIAVPVLTSVKLVCEQIDPLTPIATLLGR